MLLKKKVNDIFVHARLDKELVWIRNPADDPKAPGHAQEVADALRGLEKMKDKIEGALRGRLDKTQRGRLERLLEKVKERIRQIQEAQSQVSNN